MKFSHVIFLTVLLLCIAVISPVNSQVSVDPIGIAVFMETTDSIAVEMALTNEGETDVNFKIGFSSPPEDERNAGPRRDQPEGKGILIANSCGWSNWDFEQYFQAIDDLEYDRYRTWDDVEDVDFHDYDFMWLGNYEAEAWVADYNDNLERIEEFVDRGGALYHCNGTNNHNTRPVNPGGISYHWGEENGDQSQDLCPLQLDPEENFLINYMNENDPYDWEWGRGQQLDGSGCAHGVFYEDELEEIENCDWFEVMAIGNPVEKPIIVTYEYGQGYCVITTTVDGFLHNNPASYHWGRTGEAVIWYLDFLSTPGWIQTSDDEGVIRVDESADIDISFVTEETEAGVYEMIVEIELSEADNRDDLDVNLIMISAIMSVDSPVTNLYGEIFSAEDGVSIEGAKLDFTDYYFARFTDENGEYSVDDLPLGDYEIEISATDYLTTVEEVSIDEEDNFEFNVELLHSECTPSERQFFMQLEPGYTYEFEFQVDNGGNGPLTYSVDRRLLGDANAEPFELRQTDEIEDLTGDDMLAGAVFAEDRFFISGGNNGDNPNKIYVLNMDREVVDEFDQFVEDRYGMRDLAYDGELIWGAVEGTFYGFTTAGELEIEFSVDANLEGRALAWDPVDEVLLASDISTDIFAINRDGDVVETYRRPAELRIYGLGVWPDDPDDCYLYVFCRGPDNVGIDAFKLNPESGEYMLAQYFDVGDGRPGGIMITNQLDVYSWVIVSLVQNPDRLNVWQLAARKEWFQITPTAGVIEPDEHEGFVLTLDATGLPVDNEFCGEVVFMHDGIGQETVLDVTLSVQAGRVQTTRDIDLHIGWNTISTNLQPNDNENIEGLVDSIVTTGAMIMMKNTNGDFYRPAYDFNNIQAWNSWDGFQMLMAEAATLTIAGESVLKEDPIDLTSGWQLVSYYPRYEIEATEALATIYDHLIIAKDGYGNFCLPEWDDFSNMGNLCEGQGYFIKVDADCRLVYVPEEEEERSSASVIRSKSVYDEPGQLPVHAVTGENMSLLVTTDASLEGDVGVYAGGELVGSGVIQDGVCGIAVWGDDQSTEKIDGAISGDALEVKLLTDSGLQNASYTVLSGKLTYKTDGLTIIRLNSASELPLEFGIVSAYPNPFNSQMRVSYNLLETGVVDLAAYDVSGRRVAELTSGRQVSGVHTVMFDGKDMPSGVYMLRLQAGGQSSMMKVMLVK